MSATATSRVGSNLIKAKPQGFEITVKMEDSSTAGILPANTLIGVKADGYGEIAVPSVPYAFVGFLTEEVDVSGDTADGDTSVGVSVQVVANLKATGLTQASVGNPVYITDNQTVTETPGEGTLVRAIVAGGSAGDFTVTGIQAEDELVSVLHETTAGNFADLTSEFSVTADNTINNDGGTATTSDSLIVEYRKKTPGFVGYITEYVSATECFVFLPGRLPVGVISI